MMPPPAAAAPPAIGTIGQASSSLEENHPSMETGSFSDQSANSRSSASSHTAVSQEKIVGTSSGRTVLLLQAMHTPQWALHRYEDNSKRFLAAQAALRQHDFDTAYNLLKDNDAGESREAATKRPHDVPGNWTSFVGGISLDDFGNFSRASYLGVVGTTLVFAGRYREAVRLLGSSADSESSGGRPKGSALNALGIAYRNLGDRASALGVFHTAAHHLAPENPKAWTNLGLLQRELGNLQEANDAFYHAAHLAPRDPRTWTILGSVAQKLGNLMEANDALYTAAHLAPRNPRIWTQLGAVAMESGSLVEAEDAFKMASALLRQQAEGADDAVVWESNLSSSQDEDGLVQQQAAAGPAASKGEDEALELWYESEDHPEY